MQKNSKLTKDFPHIIIVKGYAIQFCFQPIAKTKNNALNDIKKTLLRSYHSPKKD